MFLFIPQKVTGKVFNSLDIKETKRKFFFIIIL